MILLDEVEKAHPDVFNVLLQVLDDGRLIDGQGRSVDFSQTLVLMTSNLRGEGQVAEFFRPEFIGRLDEVLTFDALGRDQIGRIVDVQMTRLRAQLAERDIEPELTPAATECLDLGHDPEFGARLKRHPEERPGRRGHPPRRARPGPEGHRRCPRGPLHGPRGRDRGRDLSAGRYLISAAELAAASLYLVGSAPLKNSTICSPSHRNHA